MKYKCAIFDLDGTLLNSLQSILDAINKTFKQYGINVVRTFEEGKSFIGAGALVFAQRAMKGLNLDPETQNKIFKTFLENYAVSQIKGTKPFPGSLELLKTLKEQGLYVCIASNKPSVLANEIIKSIYPDFHFDIIMAPNEKIPEKPDPTMINKIVDELSINYDDCIYIGDSEYDYRTAHNAGIDIAICKFGYGFYEKPWILKVKNLVNNYDEIKEILLN